MEKEIKNIKFDFQGKGKLKKAFRTPFGTIWVNTDSHVWYFDGEEEALEALQMITDFGADMNIDKAEALRYVFHTFHRVTEVTILGDNIFFEIHLQGEVEPIVDTPFGTLYANLEQRLWYFKPSNVSSLLEAGLNFHMFVTAAKEQAKTKKEAGYVLRLLKEYTILNGNCLKEEE